MREDPFVNIKEACLILEEITKCSNDVVLKMLNDEADIFISNEKNII